MQLDRLLAALSTEVEPFAMCRISGDSRLRFRGFHWTTLHFTLVGSGAIDLGHGRRLLLRPYTLVVVPADLPHSMLAASVTEPEDLEVACGRVHAAYGDGTDLFASLSEAFAVDFTETPAVRRVFERLIEEASSPQPGSVTATSALMRECLVHLLRRLCPEDDCTPPWGALADPRLGAVVAWITDHPGEPMSLESLAARAAMSRTSFVTAFTKAFGRSPMAYVRSVRMRRAAELLEATDLPIDVIAGRIGYESRSQFSRAFSHHHGIAPGSYRGHQSA